MSTTPQKCIHPVCDYSEIDKRVAKIISEVYGYTTDLDKEYIKEQIYKAYTFARDAHEGQKRLSGSPYIIHPVAATEILVSLKPDIRTIQACLLHDVVEDTDKTAKDIQTMFGKEVSLLCSGMEKISKVRYTGEKRHISSLRKMFVSMAEDLRVVFIKLSDRLHNMRTLKYHPKPEKRARIALETLHIFAPIADRFGLYQMKTALEEECFKILEPKSYRKLKKELTVLKESKKVFRENIKNEVVTLLQGKIDNYDIDFRVKSIYSIYKKLQKKNLESLSDLYDIFGVRIMVPTEGDCYRVLGYIHKKWFPIPKRFKDYIALPKPNGYKSLHTTVIGLLRRYIKQPTEIQIKTYKMKEFADFGVAAHFRYKEKGGKNAKDIYWVKEIKELTKNIGDNDFIGSLTVDALKDRIFVFTPKGDFIDLPAGSTPIDFAYYLHTNLGNHISLAKVNKQVYPLDKELQNGDVVEVIVDKNKKPNLCWMSFVKTLKAKNNIKSYLKKGDKGLYRERGKEIMNKYFEKVGLPQLDKECSILKILDSREYSPEGRLQILEQVGNFSLTPPALLKRIFKSQNTKGKNDYTHKSTPDSKARVPNTLHSHSKYSSSKSKLDIIIGGEENISYILGRCCRRKVPNDIVAHINKKGIITIHRKNCKILNEVNKDRILPAYIKGTQEENLFIDMFLKFQKNPGILKELTEILYTMNIDFEEISTKIFSDVYIGINLKIILVDYDYIILERLLDRIKLHFQHTLIEHTTRLRK